MQLSAGLRRVADIDFIKLRFQLVAEASVLLAPMRDSQSKPAAMCRLIPPEIRNVALVDVLACVSTVRACRCKPKAAGRRSGCSDGC